jgi:DNA-binding transcriptional regulator YhcF (GntR family)
MKINPNTHEPIYLQIVAEVRKAISAGVYRPGEMIPSLRALAMDLQVNPNTVQRAYDELEREGVIVARRGVGLFVADRDTRQPRTDAEKSMLAAFGQSIRAGIEAGLPPERIRAVFDRALGQTLTKATRQ